MSDTYSGTATLIREDGSEIAVTAELRTSANGLRTDWGGTIAAAPQHRVVLANETSGRLRLKDGREGAFARPEPSTWVTEGRARVQGSDGEVPF